MSGVKLGILSSITLRVPKKSFGAIPRAKPSGWPLRIFLSPSGMIKSRIPRLLHDNATFRNMLEDKTTHGGKGDDGARVVEWRAWMIQQVRNQNRPSLVSPLLSTAAATTWLDGRFGLSFVVGGSSELRVTTELPGNTVSNDNEHDNERLRRSRKLELMAIADARRSHSG